MPRRPVGQVREPRRARGCLRDEQDAPGGGGRAGGVKPHDLLRTSVLRDFLMTSAANLYGAIRLRVPAYSHLAPTRARAPPPNRSASGTRPPASKQCRG